MGKRILQKIVLGVLLCVATESEAQRQPDYVPGRTTKLKPNALGIRIGGTSGLSLKHSFTEQNRGELIAGRTHYSFGITALFEHYVQTTAEGLSVFFGGGAHLAKPLKRNYLVSDEGHTLRQAYTFDQSNVIAGIDGIVGLEFLFNEIPVSISAEFKPYAEFYKWTGSSLVRLDPGVGLRYHF